MLLIQILRNQEAQKAKQQRMGKNKQLIKRKATILISDETEFRAKKHLRQVITEYDKRQ